MWKSTGVLGSLKIETGSVSYRLDLKLGIYVKWTYKSWG